MASLISSWFQFSLIYHFDRWNVFLFQCNLMTFIHFLSNNRAIKKSGKETDLLLYASYYYKQRISTPVLKGILFTLTLAYIYNTKWYFIPKISNNITIKTTHVDMSIIFIGKIFYRWYFSSIRYLVKWSNRKSCMKYQFASSVYLIVLIIHLDTINDFLVI